MSIHYQFSVEEAQYWHSTDIAVILHNIRFWLQKNKANQHNIHDGRVWTYNSMRAWSELFPWLSVDQIKKLLKKLEESGLLLKGNYNKNPLNRTNWYSLNEDQFLVDQPLNSQKDKKPKNQAVGLAAVHMVKRPNGYGQTTQCIWSDDPMLTDNKQTDSKSVNSSDTRAKNFSLTAIMEALKEMGMPSSEKWYAHRKAQEYAERFPGSRSVVDASRYVVNAIEHAWKLEGRTMPSGAF